MAGFRLRLVAMLLLAASTACSTGAPVAAEVPEPAAGGGAAPRRIDFAAQHFERAGTEDGVVVFENSSASMIRIGAEGRLPAPPAAVLAALLDYPRHPAVLERVAEARVVERGDGWLNLYQRLALPVISDRDFNLHVTWGKRGGWHWIRYRAVREGQPAVDGVVRVTRNHGGWDLLPVDGGRATLARYQSNMDMAGSLPVWMAKSGALDELPSLFRSICALLPQPFASRCGD